MKAEPSETIDPKTRQAITAFIRQVSARYPLHEAILFGSRVSGTARADSDADVAIILDGPHGSFMKTKLDMADMAFDVMLDTGIRIQPLPIWLQQWTQPDTWSNPELLQNIAHTGIPVWQASLH